MILTKYYSGFCLENEKELFDEYLIENDFTISGFSYGAIKAFEEVYHSKKRVDLLQLFSPAFFQSQSEKFKRMQVMFYSKDKKEYSKNFLQNVAYPSKIDIQKYFKQGSLEELNDLLNYIWDEKKLQKLVNRGTKIEVYLGSEDKIIDSKKAKDFFMQYATVYYIKEKGHIL